MLMKEFEKAGHLTSDWVAFYYPGGEILTNRFTAMQSRLCNGCTLMTGHCGRYNEKATHQAKVGDAVTLRNRLLVVLALNL